MYLLVIVVTIHESANAPELCTDVAVDSTVQGIRKAMPVEAQRNDKSGVGRFNLRVRPNGLFDAREYKRRVVTAIELMLPTVPFVVDVGIVATDLLFPDPKQMRVVE